MLNPVDVEIVDSTDGHNPVIAIEQDNPHAGKMAIQLNQYQAAKLANRLVEKVDELESFKEKGAES